MIVFLDTEFTSLDSQPELLSIGMVTIDGREHYSELDLTSDVGKRRLKVSSTFVHDTVLPQWGRVPDAAGSALEMGQWAGKWLVALSGESGDAKVQVVFDFKTDFELLEGAVRASGLWDVVRDVVLPIYIDPLTANIDGDIDLEDCYRGLFERGLELHHALADAIALRQAYQAMNTQQKSAID